MRQVEVVAGGVEASVATIWMVGLTASEPIRMEFPELIRQLCERPGFWVAPPYFTSACAFIIGYAEARDGGPLDGFREWLIVRARGGNNFTWVGLVKVAIGAGADPVEWPTDEQEKSRLQGMAALLDEFFRYREEQGTTKIHYEYARWLLRQRWYTGHLRKKPK